MNANQRYEALMGFTVWHSPSVKHKSSEKVATGRSLLQKEARNVNVGLAMEVKFTKMAVKIVIFDLFQTLVSEFDTGHPSTTEVAQALGLPVKDFQREYVNHRPARMTGQLDYAVSLRYIVKKLGGKSSESTIKTLAEHRQSAFTAHLRCIEPEILDMLNEVTTSGIRLGLISNTDGSEVLDWANTPLARFFEVTIFSHVVGMAKPDPHIYQHACKNLGVAPSDCIFIGDGNSDELRGAAQVGMLPFCAAWFLRRYTDLLGEDIVMRRAVDYPVLYHPSELGDRVRLKSR